MTEILQKTIPYDVLVDQALPGVGPLATDAWLYIDDAYAAQMQERERLLRTQKDQVLGLDPMAKAAADELRDVVVAQLLALHDGFSRDGDVMTCPDGRKVDLTGPALEVIGRIAQNDFCILQKPEGADEHILSAGVLCFPANWRLSEKFLRPLTGIHTPVDSYDATMARRVQRMFDALRVGQVLWRFNALWYDDPTLFQQGRGGNPKPLDGQRGTYLRSERQTFYRLPISGAVVFGIHTFMVRAEDLP